MKVECPVCGIEGFLEVRGNSKRVVHYKGMVDGKRVYERHPIGNNGNQKMGINKQDLCLNGVYPSLAVGLRRGVRGPLNRKPSIGRAESLGEASKIVRIPQSSNRDYPSLGAGGRGATFVGRLWTAFIR